MRLCVSHNSCQVGLVIVTVFFACRYDLLCTEGIARALNIFNSSPGIALPSYRLDPPTPRYTMTVTRAVSYFRDSVFRSLILSS